VQSLTLPTLDPEETNLQVPRPRHGIESASFDAVVRDDCSERNLRGALGGARSDRDRWRAMIPQQSRNANGPFIIIHT